MDLGVIPKWTLKPAWKFSKWLLALLTRRLIEPILYQSHQVHLDRCRWQHRWEPLCREIDYKLIRATIYNEDTCPESHIYIRNNSEKAIDKLDFSVIAELGKLEMPSRITVTDLPPEKIRRIPLPEFPIEDLNIVDDQIVPSYGHFYLRLHEIVIDGISSQRKLETLHASPTHALILNGSWIRIFGKLWNTNAITDLEGELREKLYWFFLARHGLFYGTGATSI